MTTEAARRFFSLADYGSSLLTADEILFSHFVGEESAFVRWNGARVRQAMTVTQGHVSLSLSRGLRRDTTMLAVSGQEDDDRARVRHAVENMRASLSSLPEDPYLLVSTEPTTSERVPNGRLPDPAEALDTIFRAAEGTDLVGICASGPVRRGLASSLGHRHFHEVDSFQFDFSLYLRADKAVSASYTTPRFDAAALASRIEAAKQKLAHLGRPQKTISPGKYRAYLTPAAMSEIVGMLNWGGVSEKAQRTKTSDLHQLIDGSATLSPRLTLSENTAEGLAPAFDEVGFVRPARVTLIDAGKHAGSMVGPRTAKEYGLSANADSEEIMRSADIAPGELAEADVLRTLDTGVYVGNLWYLGFSDRPNARLTGMTRFATFWVEHGEIVAPLSVMRFDDSLFRMLGTELVALTKERDFQVSTQSYGQRSVESTRLPGALLGELTFTL